MFRFSDELHERSSSPGRSLESSDWELPMPATYVIDRGDVIRFAHVDPEDTRRAEPLDMLAAPKGAA